MDEELQKGSTPPMGDTPTGQKSHGRGSSGQSSDGQSALDWNTSLVGPAPEITAPLTSTVAATSVSTAAGTDASPSTADAAPDGSGSGVGDAGAGRGKSQPVWQEPAELPAVQRVLAGSFGEKVGVLRDAARTIRAVMASIDVDTVNDAELVALTQVVEEVGRPVDAARVTTATVVAYRARRSLGRDSLAWRLGATRDLDLLTRLTRCSDTEMKRRITLGEKVCPRMSTMGAQEPVFPIVAAALTSGELGVEAAAVIVKALGDYTVHGRLYADQAQVRFAEAKLVENATGSRYGHATTDSDTDGGATDGGADEAGAGTGTGPVCRVGDSDLVAVGADHIQAMTPAWQAFLNPDGAAPNAPLLEAKSSFSFGTLRDGLYPLRGGVTPDLKGVMQNLFNTYQSARTAVKFPSAEDQQRIEAGELIPGEILDERTGGEKRADILRGILTQVAQDPRTPTMGGMPPTVMVHVNATDLLKNSGVGWIDGVEGPVSMKSINQMIDNGGMQPIFFGGNGAVLGLGSKARCFSPLQRKAITARDGGCIIPGCTCPPQWCEVHHVEPWQYGGRTHVDNGVLLCWYHHHTITSSTGWKIRMVRGVPQVKAPHWIDPTEKWRTPDKHRAHDPRTRRPPDDPETPEPPK
ncbi:HNH endonuclease signature motif containing protein [Cryobacterium arcticum]|uniref:HNH nuclease domain-containing protein n=1 Tax=Cryobacterium arcticum TaxID=670052 RepID=A0A317ZTV4_9MICO|nr:HNH endonuclease signature motif containing protein [Cryobacterium arcticum]PXA70678.1 hypothetical protein CTB96_06225 [Cryobacterium arcticum]